MTEIGGKFVNAVFQIELRQALIRIESHDCKCFEQKFQKFLSLLNFHALMKSKNQCANHKSCMTKTQRKAIIKQFEVAYKYYKTKNTVDYNSYKKQSNFCSNLYKKEKKIL